jgi:MoCo/4Fe-4S cofactor protein with predicted Tat translocation signal
MKRVFEHPAEAATGKRYWRSVGQLSDTPEFRNWLEREFPSGAAQMEGDEWSRRGFLKVMGASCSVFEKCRMGHPRQATLLCDGNAAPHGCVTARGQHGRWTSY